VLAEAIGRPWAGLLGVLVGPQVCTSVIECCPMRPTEGSQAQSRAFEGIRGCHENQFKMHLREHGN
jgi:hypothetical protein